jgi:hypothetical protein
MNLSSKNWPSPILLLTPPSHWGLCRLGESFPTWLLEHYHHPDRYLVTHCAQIDWVTNCAAWTGTLSPFDFASLSSEEILATPLRLQPSIHLFSLEGDFFSFREAMLANPPEYYNSNTFPSMNYGDFHFVLYRTAQNMVTWKQISHAEKVILSLLQEGHTISQACAALEERGGGMLEKALAEIPLWFKQWTVLSWFGQP